MSRREADHADAADPAVHDLHHGHRHPLRLLLSHQAAESRAGAGGGRCLFTRVLRFTSIPIQMLFSNPKLNESANFPLALTT